MKVIQGVAYRHVLLTAYVKVAGRSTVEALKQANGVRSEIAIRLPEADVRPPRYRGVDEHLGHIFEVPAIIAKCARPARAVLARMVLRGSIQ
jgi:hypothetical protein